ncbi:unnamed protein product [Rotaria sp. Silwood2]|nr:unnamed protein product [Rotaria sp. Silwood2]
MFQLDILMDTSLLPSNVISLLDDDFIEFVKNEAGCPAAAALLEIQGINCVKSLLMADNVYAVMLVKSKSLDGFENKNSYMQDDGPFICIENAKSAKLTKRNQLSSSVLSLDIASGESSTIAKPT